MQPYAVIKLTVTPQPVYGFLHAVVIRSRNLLILDTAPQSPDKDILTRTQFSLQHTSRGGCARRRSSADHLGRLEEEGWRNRQTELLGRVKIDDQLERRRLLDRSIRRFGFFENFIDVIGGTLETLRIAGGIQR